MLFPSLALVALLMAPPGDAAPATPAGERGELVLRPGPQQGVKVTDGAGKVIARIDAAPRGGEVRLNLGPGEYFVFDEGDQPLAKVVMSAGGSAAWKAPDAVEPPAPTPVPAETAGEAPPEPPGPAVQPEPRKKSKAHRGDDGRDEGDPTRPRWKVPVTPIMSALVPGLGQMVNRQPAKGAGILVGSAALATGAWFLDQSSPRSTGRQVAFATLTGGLVYLYAYGIADAYSVASGKHGKIAPERDFKLRVSVGRMATVAPSGRYEGTDLYTDWTVDVIGQPVRRFTLGLSDVSVKVDPKVERTTVQFGGRLGGRVYDKKRFWLTISAGALMQYTVAKDQPRPLDPDKSGKKTEARFGATPYAQLEMRYFILDRFSLDLTPRFSVPLETRYYGASRALPRYAPTFELGTGVGVVF